MPVMLSCFWQIFLVILDSKIDSKIVNWNVVSSSDRQCSDSDVDCERNDSTTSWMRSQDVDKSRLQPKWTSTHSNGLKQQHSQNLSIRDRLGADHHYFCFRCCDYRRFIRIILQICCETIKPGDMKVSTLNNKVRSRSSISRSFSWKFNRDVILKCFDCVSAWGENKIPSSETKCIVSEKYFSFLVPLISELKRQFPSSFITTSTPTRRDVISKF